MAGNKNTKTVMDKNGIDRCLTRIAYEILEKNKGMENLVLVGIRTGGVYLSERLQKKISGIEGGKIPLGILDVNLYRDDISASNKKQPLGETKINFSLDDKIVVLIDDVLFTGRTSWRSSISASAGWGTGSRRSCTSRWQRSSLPSKATRSPRSSGMPCSMHCHHFRK